MMIIAMFLAHLVGDYILQWDSLALWKSRELKGVLAHGLVVTFVTFLFILPFEPTWWQRLWATPKWGFASAAMLSGAILFHAVTRPVPVVQTAAPVTVQQTADARIANVDALIQAAVAKATADLEQRYQVRTAQMVKAAEERLLIEHRQDMVAMDANNQMMLRKLNTYMRASNDLGAGQ